MDQGWSAEVDVLSADVWDGLASGFSDITYDQTAAGTQTRWGSKRSSHLLLRRDGLPAAGAQVVILTLPVLRQGLAYIKFGPFWRRGERPDPDVYRRMVSALVAEYCVRRGHLLRILPRPNPAYLELEAGVLRELGFTQRHPMTDPNRYLVKVGLDPADQMRGLDQKWRYNLRQAQRHDIECRISDDAGDWSAFVSLHEAMESRKGFRDSALDGVPELMRRLPAAMRPRIALASHQGRPIAGAIVGLLGDTAYYVFGASSEAALPLKAGYALHWWIVNALAGQGVLWYDLGGEVLEPGLRQFKKGFVGKTGAIVTMPGEFDYWTHPIGRMVADGMHGARAAKGAVRSLLGRAAR